METDAIIFDLDDTLYNAGAAYKKALSLMGFDELGSCYLKARGRVKARLPCGHVSSHNRLLYFKEILENNKTFSSQKVLDLLSQYEKILELEIKNEWRKIDRFSFIKKLKEHYTIILLTNENTRTQLLKLRAIDPSSEIFDKIVTSEEVGFEKPSFELFNYVFELYRIDPKRCLMVGDSIDVDIVPALEFGCQGVLSTEYWNDEDRTKIYEKPNKFYVLNKLEDLDRILFE